MIMHVLETALYTDDLETTAAFYADMLGLERVVEIPGRHVFFRVEGGVLLLFDPGATTEPPRDPRMPVPPHGATGPGHVCFAASADEIDAWVAKFDAAGIEIEADFEWPQGGRSVYFRDPAGNSIEFAEPRIWGL
jgi:catechol 2,3-dioxygenase-like lactoylglutathione lyase family enzyme